MSSQDLLVETVREWSQEKCKSSLEEVLPKLIESLQHGKEVQPQIEIFHIMCHLFIHHLPRERLEPEFFSQTLPEVNMLISNLYEELNGILSNNNDLSLVEEQAHSLIEMICSLLESLIKCTEVLNVAKELLLEHFCSVPRVVVNAVMVSYKHCNMSKEAYGEIFASFENVLNNLYKKISSLLMTFLSVLEKTSFDLALEDDMKELVFLCKSLCSISEEVSKIEMKSMVSVWKTYTKLITQYQDSLKTCLDVGHTLKFLCSRLEENISHLWSQITFEAKGQAIDWKDFAKLVKISSIDLKVIVTVCDKFQGYIDDGIAEIVHLILVLYRLSPSNLQIVSKLPEDKVAMINQNLTVGIESLVTYLIDNGQFMESVLKVCQDCSIWAEYSLSVCLLICAVLEKLQGVDDVVLQNWIWYEDKHSLLDGVFMSLQYCYVESNIPIYFPGLMLHGKSAKMVSLYEYFITRLCAVIAILPDSLFHVLEKILCSNIFQSHPLRILLAQDVWCFVARYGQSKLCFDHCCLLASLCQFICEQGLNPFPVQSLLKRMVRFLSKNHKTEFAARFSPENHPQLWTFLPIDIFPAEIRMNAIQYTLPKALGLMHQCCSEKLTGQFLKSLVLHMKILTNLVCEAPEIELDVHVLSSAALELTKKLVSTKGTEVIVSSLVHLFSSLLPYLHGKLLLEVLKTVYSVWTMSEDKCCLSVTLFLRKCVTKEVSECVEDGEILDTLSLLFSESLQSSNQLTLQSALESLVTFAYHTKHESVLAQCLQSDEKTREMVEQYLTQEPASRRMGVEEIMSVLLAQKASLEKSENCENLVEEIPVCIPKVEASTRSPSREENKTESLENLSVHAREIISNIIGDMKHCVDQLDQVVPDRPSCSKSSIPGDLLKELRSLHCRIEKYL